MSNFYGPIGLLVKQEEPHAYIALIDLSQTSCNPQVWNCLTIYVSTWTYILRLYNSLDVYIRLFFTNLCIFGRRDILEYPETII